jgi:hypothetical protein
MVTMLAATQILGMHWLIFVLVVLGIIALVLVIMGRRRV